MIEVNHGIRTTTDQTFTQVKQSTDAIINRVRLLTNIPELVIEQFLNDVLADFCKKTWILQKTIEVGDEIEGEPDPVPDDDAVLYENNFLNDPDGAFSIANSDYISSSLSYILRNDDENLKGEITTDGFVASPTAMVFILDGFTTKNIKSDISLVMEGSSPVLLVSLSGSSEFAGSEDLVDSMGFRIYPDGNNLVTDFKNVADGFSPVTIATGLSSWQNLLIDITATLFNNTISIVIKINGSDVYNGSALLEEKTGNNFHIAAANSTIIKSLKISESVDAVLYENNFLSGQDEDPFSISNSDFISPSINYSLYQSNEDYRGRVISFGFTPRESSGYEMLYAALQFSGIGDSVSADIAWMGEEMVDLCIFLKADIPNDQYTGWKCQTVGVDDVATLGVLPYNGTAGTNETAVTTDWMYPKKLRCVASLKDDSLSILIFVDDVQQYQRSISVSAINTDTILIYINNRIAIESLKITGVTSS